MSEVKTPWKDYMGDVPMHLDYFQGSMFEAVERMAELYPNNIAFDFMGKSTTYKKMVQEIEKCAKSLKTLGVRPGDKSNLKVSYDPDNFCHYINYFKTHFQEAMEITLKDDLVSPFAK